MVHEVGRVYYSILTPLRHQASELAKDSETTISAIKLEYHLLSSVYPPPPP